MARDRIVELRRVPASQLAPSPANWRLHPDTQRQALAEVLDEVGIADAVIARQTADGLELVDGHLRTDLAGDEVVPVLVVDLDDEEAATVLATLDPIAAMADADHAALSELLADLSASSEAITAAVWSEDVVSALTTPVPDPLEPETDPGTGRPAGKMGIVNRGSPSYVGIGGAVHRIDDEHVIEWLRPDPIARLAEGLAAWEDAQ